MSEMSIDEAIKEIEQTKEAMEVSCAMRAGRTGDMKYPSELKALDMAITALKFSQAIKECLTDAAFSVISSSTKETKAWVERILWNCKRVDELSRQRQEKVQKCIERIKAEWDKESVSSVHKIRVCDAIDIIKEEMGCDNESM